MKRVLILGATSAVARALSAAFARKGDSLLLAARNLRELERIQADLRVRYQATVHVSQLDAAETDLHSIFLDEAVRTLGGLDVVVFAIGLLGEQPGDSHQVAPALDLIHVNFSAAVSLLAPLANLLEKQGAGAIVGISSVAGDRGRQSNYVYGAAKGGLSLYLQGLRNRLNPSGVRVYTVKPGFVDTSMTYGLPGLVLVAQPEQIATSIQKMLNQPVGVYYMPGFWRWIMLIVKVIPEFVFRRLKL